MRSKCDWYEREEKSTKFFLNLEKSRSSQGVVHSILKNKIEVKNQSEINNELYKFYKNLFKENLNTSKEVTFSFIENINLPALANEQALECEGIISETELLKALKSMKNDKSPGNDRITKEFHELFWDDIKHSLSDSIKKSFISGELSTSQKQAVLKLIEKKEKDKRLIKNWRPISLLNIDTKLISKIIAIRLQKILNNLISENQNVYLNNRCISEGGRLISDIVDITDLYQIEGILLTVDIEKAFDSVNHLFLVSALENCGFKSDFISWIKLLLKNQESYLINGGQATNYFKLEIGARQRDPLSAYLFILVLEIAFIKIKRNPNIKSLNVCNNDFLYTACADDTTFSLQNEKSATEILNNFNIMSQFSGLKINKSKCEAAGIGVMKGVKMALCGEECVNLLIDAIKILGIYFSYNKELENEKNFLDHITKLQKVINIWKMRNLSLLRK